MEVVLFVLAAVIGYLLGSISFAVIITRWAIRRDVREMGSGNAGMTNVMRTAGFLPGALTFVLDFLKAAIACLIAKHLVFGWLAGLLNVEIPLAYGLLVCGLFCQLGHIFPVFFDFRGGKAVACTAGIFSVCNWKVLAVCVAVFLIVFLFTRIISAASVSAMIALPIAEYFTVAPQGRLLMVVLSAVIAGIVIVKHKDNICRIFKGEEKKLVIRRRKKG
ncbi:MAG: glycerol-3-phosphate 1-O-acyltransferase PlsY [Clostridia bacterium]|nr:glycerol-3-phosphate 1-O-acyltransferase PlsY [Clostridia bacterium]